MLIGDSDREALAAPAFALYLRVDELEALLLEGVDEIEGGAVQVDEALRVHVDLGALYFEDLVARAGLVAELDHVAHARAAAALDAQAHAALGGAVRALRELRLDLLRGARGDVDASFSHRLSSPRASPPAGRRCPSSSSSPQWPP